MHNKKEDLWIVINGKVLNVSAFADNHPGGPAILLARSGDDATRGFNDANHTKNAIDQLS
jgi:cytochrome b involved in lipid metabolism